MADICDRSKWYRNLWFPCKDGRRRRKKTDTHTGRIRANWTWSNFDLHPIFFNLGCSYNHPPIFITSQVFCCFRRSQAGNHHFLPKVMWLWINGEVSTVVRHKGLVPLEIHHWMWEGESIFDGLWRILQKRIQWKIWYCIYICTYVYCDECFVLVICFEVIVVLCFDWLWSWSCSCWSEAESQSSIMPDQTCD